MKNNRKVLYGLVALALVLSVAGISVGFAAMSTELKIEGQAEVIPASWGIIFKNLTLDSKTGTANVKTAPTITGDTHIGNYDVELSAPGDYVVYTFDVENTGSMDAKLTTFTKAVPTITGTGDTAVADAALVTSNLDYTLTYDGGGAIGVNDELAAGETKSLVLTIGYKSAADALPTAKVNITGMDVTFVYSQK